MDLLYFFGLYPFLYSFLEWNIHRLLHVFKSKRHNEHHIILKSDNDYISNFRKSTQTLLVMLPLCFIDPNLISFWINYTMYEFIHTWLHRNRCNASNFHNIHHFSRNWDKNYGVLSPFWDMVFGTMRTGRGINWWKFIYNWNPYLFLFNF